MLQNFVTSFSAGLYKEYVSKNIVVQVGSPSIRLIV